MSIYFNLVYHILFLLVNYIYFLLQVVRAGLQMCHHCHVQQREPAYLLYSIQGMFGNQVVRGKTLLASRFALWKSSVKD